MAGAVGLIGIGNLGSAIAENLLGAGYRVVGYDQRDTAAFAAKGGVAAGSAADVARAAPVVVCCLATETAAEEVAAEMATALCPGQVVLDLATHPLEFKNKLAARIGAAGAMMLDGEMSGTPDMVRAHRAVILLGGDAAAVATVRPVCDAVTAKTFHLGPFGAAARMKLINNLLSAVHNLAAAEAMALGVKAGFEPKLLVEVLTSGSGTSAFLASRAPYMAERRFEPSAGALATFEKYLDLIPRLAEDVACATPLFDAAERCYRAALAEGRGGQDIAAMFEVVEAMPRGRNR